MATSYNLDSGFLLSYDWLPALESLPGEEYKELLSALIRLQRDGTALPMFKNPLLNIFAAMISPTIKRRMDGQRGGRRRDGTQSLDRDTTVDTTVASKVKQSKVYLSLSGESDMHARTRERNFTPPTVEEVRAYCETRKNTVDAEKFVDHYTATGWHVGQTPMQDWKAAVRKWEKSESAIARSSERRDGASANSTQTSFDTDDFFMAATERSYGVKFEKKNGNPTKPKEDES